MQSENPPGKSASGPERENPPGPSAFGPAGAEQGECRKLVLRTAGQRIIEIKIRVAKIGKRAQSSGVLDAGVERSSGGRCGSERVHDWSTVAIGQVEVNAEWTLYRMVTFWNRFDGLCSHSSPDLAGPDAVLTVCAACRCCGRSMVRTGRRAGAGFLERIVEVRVRVDWQDREPGGAHPQFGCVTGGSPPSAMGRRPAFSGSVRGPQLWTGLARPSGSTRRPCPRDGGGHVPAREERSASRMRSATAP